MVFYEIVDKSGKKKRGGRRILGIIVIMTGKLVVVVFSHLFTKTYVAVLHNSVRQWKEGRNTRRHRNDSFAVVS